MCHIGISFTVTADRSRFLFTSNQCRFLGQLTDFKTPNSINWKNQLLIDRNKIVLYLLNRFKELFFCLKTEQNRNIFYKTSQKEEKMKDKIIAYGKEYIDNFKQNPLSATAVLTIQIIFILGWGVFFLYLLWLYSSFVIPGVTNPKGNIYADTLYTILLTAVYPYCCYKFGKMLFSSHTSLKLKLWAIFCSLICAFLLFPAHNGVQLLPFFRSGTYTAFWAQWQNCLISYIIIIWSCRKTLFFPWQLINLFISQPKDNQLLTDGKAFAPAAEQFFPRDKSISPSTRKATIFLYSPVQFRASCIPFSKQKAARRNI